LGKRAEVCLLGMTLFNIDDLRFVQKCVQAFGRILWVNREIFSKSNKILALVMEKQCVFVR